MTHLNFSLAAHWYTPVFSSLLEKRAEGRIILCAGCLHLGLSLLGISLWTCPIRLATGIPCPGCGLTRGIVEFFHGDLSTSMQVHAFAPIFILALGLLFAVLILPEQLANRVISQIRRLEERSGVTAILLVLLMVYWISRILGFIPFPKIF